MPGVIVLGYGSELRRDDAAGRRVAEAVAALGLPGVRVVVAHQLLPEHAADVVDADAVVFVDASVADRTVTVRAVSAGPAAAGRLSHALAPEQLLALASALGGAPRRAWTVAVPVSDLGLGERPSRAGAAAIDAAIDAVACLLDVARTGVSS